MNSNVTHDKGQSRKKLISFALQTGGLLLVICLAFVVFYFIYGYTNKDLQNNSIVGLDLVSERVYSDGTATAEQLDVVDNFIATMSPIMKKKYKEQNWLIILAESPPTTIIEKTITFDNSNYDHNTYKLLGGVTIPVGKIIYLNTNVDSIEKFEENLVHEFGHCVDYFVGYLSRSDENTLMYQQYSPNSNLFDGYERSNTVEFFASAYKEYILYPDLVKTEAPALYEYMNSAEEKMYTANSFFVNIVGFIRLVIYNFKGVIGKT